jgi:uncharacterized membrane protein
MRVASSPYAFRAGPWAVVTVACLAVLALAMLPPFAPPGLGAAITRGFHLVCHQLPDRSFAVGGVPFALCHRCLGVLAGLVVGAGLAASVGRWRAALVPLERPLFLLALALASADWLLGVSGLWANSPLSRFSTGFLVGVTAGYLLARAVAAPGEAAHRVQPVPAPVS